MRIQSAEQGRHVASRVVLPVASSSTGEARPKGANCVSLWCPEVPGNYTVSLHTLPDEFDVISEVSLKVHEWNDRRRCSLISLHNSPIQCGGEIIVTAYNSNDCSGGSWVVCRHDSPLDGAFPARHGWFLSPSSSDDASCRTCDYVALEHAPQFSLPAPREASLGQLEVRYVKTVGDATCAPTTVARGYLMHQRGEATYLQPHQIYDLESLPAWKSYGCHGPYFWKESLGTLRKVLSPRAEALQCRVLLSIVENISVSLASPTSSADFFISRGTCDQLLSPLAMDTHHNHFTRMGSSERDKRKNHQ